MALFSILAKTSRRQPPAFCRCCHRRPPACATNSAVKTGLRTEAGRWNSLNLTSASIVPFAMIKKVSPAKCTIAEDSGHPTRETLVGYSRQQTNCASLDDNLSLLKDAVVFLKHGKDPAHGTGAKHRILHAPSTCIKARCNRARIIGGSKCSRG